MALYLFMCLARQVAFSHLCIFRYLTKVNKALETSKAIKQQRIHERCEELFKLISEAKTAKIAELK